MAKKILQAPNSVPLPRGCEELPHFPMDIGRRKDLSQGPASQHFQLYYSRKKTDLSVLGFAWFGLATQGPPQHVHGGVSALALDEAMGAVVWLRNMPAVASQITFELLEMVPIHQLVSVEARVERVRGKKIFVSCRIFQGKNVFVAGRGIFHRLSDARVRMLLRKSDYRIL